MIVSIRVAHMSTRPAEEDQQREVVRGRASEEGRQREVVQREVVRGRSSEGGNRGRRRRTKRSRMSLD